MFDILHAGHVQLLRRARALGDVLVVGLNSDASTRRLKGPTRPVNRESDRIALVSALDVVDYAVLFDEDTPAELIRAIRPHVHVKGGDYLAESLPEIGAVHEVGAEVEILSLVAGRSTTALIDRIVATATAGERSRGSFPVNASDLHVDAPVHVHEEWRQARRVLAVRLDNLGDVLVTTPAIHAMRESLPDATITLLASPVGAQAGRLNPDVDEVIVYNAPWMDPWSRLPLDPAREMAGDRPAQRRTL